MADPHALRVRYTEGLSLLPEHMRGGVIRYMDRGIRPGDFLLTMLKGDMEDARRRADGVNQRFEKEWGTFLSDYLPVECHNTPEKVEAWMKMGGLAGMVDGTG